MGDTINETLICEKAKALYNDLLRRTPATSPDEEGVFKASRGCFQKFKNRTGIHCVTHHWEAANADTKAAEDLVKEFKTLVESDGYVAQQVFNCNKTGLS